jgi:hypothetical protein
MQLFLISLITLNFFAGGLSFFENGKKIKKADSLVSKNVQEEVIQVYNILSYKNHTYIGVKFYDLLEDTFGENWKNAKKFIFLATDGYASSINIKKMLKTAKDKVPYLVYKEMGLKEFSNFVRKKKLSKKTLKYVKWPYQLKRIGIIR